MDRHALFRLWAPPESPWSLWAKPSVFAHWSETSDTPDSEPTAIPGIALPSTAERCALVIDAPGAKSVALGLAAAACGYRPVPLFNSCPARPEDYVSAIASVVDAKAVLLALAAGASRLATLPIDPHAPPAFFLDANRCPFRRAANANLFDNRSVVFPADFPSATILEREAIRRVLIVQDTAQTEIMEDLRHALRHWRERGVPIAAMSSDAATIEVNWPRHGWWGEIQQRFFALIRLRRNAVGGFGGIVPDSSAG